MYYNYTVQKKNKKMGPYIGIFFGSKNFISEQREHVFLNCSDVIKKKLKKKFTFFFCSKYCSKNTIYILLTFKNPFKIPTHSKKKMEQLSI